MGAEARQCRVTTLRISSRASWAWDGRGQSWSLTRPKASRPVSTLPEPQGSRMALGKGWFVPGRALPVGGRPRLSGSPWCWPCPGLFLPKRKTGVSVSLLQAWHLLGTLSLRRNNGGRGRIVTITERLVRSKGKPDLGGRGRRRSAVAPSSEVPWDPSSHRAALPGGKLPSPANLIPAGMVYTYAP